MKCLKGSYTVEISVIMFIVIMTLCSILYLAFYLHDRALAESVLLEQAEQGRFLERSQTEDTLSEIGAKKARPFLCLREATIKITRKQGKVTGEIQGIWKIPFSFAGKLLLQGNSAYETTITVKVFEPEEFLRLFSVFE